MNLKDLKHYFDVEKFVDMNSEGQPVIKNEYLLWDKDQNSGQMFPRRYFCRIRDIGRGIFIVVDRENNIVGEFKNIEIITNFIHEYVDSLPYHSDVYYPNYRPGFFISLCVQSFLKKLGFKSDYHVDNGYVLEIKNIYGGLSSKIELSFDGLGAFDETNEINIYLYNSEYSFMKVTCKRNVDSVIKELNGLLKPMFLTNGIKNIELSDMLVVEDFNGSINELNMKNFSIESSDYKEQLRLKLTEILNKLN
jgi:hypothetical protein